MKDQKKVLIAIDYNIGSNKVAEIGYEFAAAMNAKITLLHVVENNTYYTSFVTSPITGIGNFDTATFFQYLNTDTPADAADYYLDKIKMHLNDDKINTLVEIGELSDGILTTAKKLDTDLIIIGSHNQKWLEKLLVGSTTESIINHSSIPIMIIPISKNE